MPIDSNGRIFTAFSRGRVVEPATLDCASAAVDSLLTVSTAAEPGLLFGKVQSGKTRTFITALALAFDNGFDVSIVFTKGVKVLTQQTVARLIQEFRTAVDQDLVQVFEVMSMPENLPPALVSQKLVIVCKKEDDNIKRLHSLLDSKYPELKSRRCLIIDDEADFASIGYRRDGGAVVTAVIPSKIDRVRQLLNRVAVLQVTATPYSLYLQPSVVPLATGLTQPVRPAFTKVVPSGPGYVGGDVYFERSQRQGSFEELFYVPVPLGEMDVLRREDPARFNIEECVTSREVDSFRRSIVTFLLGGFIRRWQERRANAPKIPRFAFIVHSETARASHLWQVRLAERIRDDLRRLGRDDPRLQELVQLAHDDLGESIRRAGLEAPELGESIAGVREALDSFMVHKVNSESQVQRLLNPVNGELDLVAHYNLFVGGNILDRGVTVPSVIGFFYGRRPAISQQDTVLQHCRMYGYRAASDLAVTRFYTTPGIYASMQTIHEFDTALRSDIEANRQPRGVYFLRTDSRGRVRPCGPQKVLASHIEAVAPGSQKLLLPLRFDVREDLGGLRATEWIDRQLLDQFGGPDDLGPRYGNMAAADAGAILEQIRRSLDFSQTTGWDVRGHVALLTYLASHDGRARSVSVSVIRGASQPRVRPDGRPQNYFVYQREVDEARTALGNRPGLLLVRQTPGAGFRPHPFWWPMLLIPDTVLPHVFALN